MLLDRDKASRLIEATRWILFADAETHGWVSLSNARLDEVNEEPSSNPLVPTGRDDCDRQFGDTLSDEAIAMARLGERPIPSCADRPVLFGNQSIVALPRPSSEVRRVARIGEHLLSVRCRLVGAPDCGLAQHPREKGEVPSPGRATPNVFHLGQSSSSASCVSDHGATRNPLLGYVWFAFAALASVVVVPAGLLSARRELCRRGALRLP